MVLRVFRQEIKKFTDQKVYKGEDARPYVDGQIFFVADGMGGTGAIYHKKFNQELFDEDKLMDVLFKGVYDDYSNETFVKYVKESFVELFAMKDCYKDCYDNKYRKKSGYFGSRIVTAVVLHEMLYNEDYRAEKIFLELAECENEEAKKEYLKRIGYHFKVLIQTKIGQIAKNANFYKEINTPQLKVFATTFCGTIYFEHEDCVEAIYLTAGDSRPYVWSEENGLCQLLKEQEDDNGGVNNFIKANEDNDFYIQCDYFCFKKPCVLFNASDGCFDSKEFVSQLAFEKLILECAKESNDTEGMGESLTYAFEDYGRHDDSSTIAMKIFGYDTFEAFKQACSKRLDVLHTEYLDKMKDLLDDDYSARYETSKYDYESQLEELKSEYFSESDVQDYCKKRVESGEYAPYIQKRNEIQRKIDEEKLLIDAEWEKIQDVIARNFIRFKMYIDLSHYGRRDWEQITNAENECQKTEEKLKNAIQEICNKSLSIIRTLEELCNQLGTMGVTKSFEALSEFDFKALKRYEDDFGDIRELLDDSKKGFLIKRSETLYDFRDKLVNNKKKFTDENIRLANNHKADLEKLCEMVVVNKIDFESLNISDEDKTVIREAYREIYRLLNIVSKLEDEDLTRIFEESVKAYWNANGVDIIKQIINGYKYRINIALKDKTNEIIRKYRESTKSLVEKAEQQKTIFKLYDEKYGMYINDEYQSAFYEWTPDKHVRKSACVQQQVVADENNEIEADDNSENADTQQQSTDSIKADACSADDESDKK